MTTLTHTHNVRAQKIRAISSTVGDVKRSRSFYTEAFSFKSVKFKDPDGHDLEIIWFPPDQSKEEIELVVEDIEAAVNTLRKNGVEIVSYHIVQFPDSFPYRQACSVKDPNRQAMMLITL